ncbi:MAG: MerR family transcriptional regulator [Steroidobacteraceae bacterium]
MANPEDSQLLSAAECAARTGLTTRALRVYEEQGLVAPQRSLGGWRQYGAAELIRLNRITLLKAAGLTLAQIATLLGAEGPQPAIPDLLTQQLDSWRGRKADAERGLQIVEAALERLRHDRSLTVDDLCNLIRSLEMAQPPDPAIPSGEITDHVDAKLLKRYAGLYQAGDWNIIAIRYDGLRLQIELPSNPALELRPISECDFDTIGPELPITFDRSMDGRVSGLRLRMKGGDMPATRIDEATAEQVRSRLAERIKERKALPGSEAAVRRLAESLMNGQPHYEEMHPALAYATRWQLPTLRATAARLGAIQSVEFQGVGSAGWDVYDVQHEYGKSRFRIALGSGGIITGALFQIKDGPVSLGP